MPRTFLAPPGWPTPPAGWTPPVDWQPDPSWPPAPADWVWWADELPADHPAELQTVGAAAFAPVPDAPTYAPGFQPTPPPPGFSAAPGLSTTGSFLPTGGPQATTYPAATYPAATYPANGFPSGGFQQSSSPAFGAVAPPTFLHVADQLRADAQRRILFGVVWLVGGIAVSVVATALVDGALYFWGAALYGVVQVVRGLVGYGRADRTALAQSAGMTLR